MIGGEADADRLSPVARRTVVMLAVLLTVDYADRGVLGAMTPTLKSVFGISNSAVGALSAAFGVVGALATLPSGVLVDRVRRIRLLTASAALWSVAMLVTGAATSFLMLFLSRLSLATVTATVGPAFPSIIGDVVPDPKRSRVLGFIESGQLVGNALGVGLAAAAVGVLSWRWGFWLLAVPGLAVTVGLLVLPEPDRSPHVAPPTAGRQPDDPEQDRQAALPAAFGRCLEGVTFREAVPLVLRVRTNVRLVLAVSAANYFLSGVGAFAVLFAVEQYHVSNVTADLALLALSVAALVGIVVGSWLADRATRLGRGRDRLMISAVGCALAAPLWLPALLVRSLPTALPFLVLGTGSLAAALPGLDAVRLDVVPPPLLGRAEAVRTLARTVAEGSAPLVIGVLSDHLAGGGTAGLRTALLLVLPGLLIAAVLIVASRRSYPADVQAAAASS